MASVLDIIKHYQKDIEKYSDDEAKVLRCIDKLFQLTVTVQHLQETGVGRTVNALRKEPGEVGQAARALVLKWKTMVAAEESDQEGDHRNDTSTHNGHGSGRESDDHSQHSRNMQDRYNSTKNSTPRSDHREQYKEMNGNHSGSKRKYHSSEEEDQDARKKTRHTSSSEDDHRKQVTIKKEKLTDSESSDDSDSSDSDSNSYTSESSQEEAKVKIKQEIKQEIKKEKESPERRRSSSHSSKHSHSNHDDHKKESSSSKRHDSLDKDRHSHHKSSSKDVSRQSSVTSTKSSSHKHKNSHEKENSSEKKHKSDTSSDEKKESKSSSKQSSDKHKSSSHKHESSTEKQKSSDKHSSKDHKSSLHPDNTSEKHKSSSHTESTSEKHKSSSEKDTSKHKSKESSSSKDKQSSSSKEKSKDRSDSSKERSNHGHSSEKRHSSSERKSQSSDKSKNKSDDGSSEKKSREKSGSSSSHKSKTSRSSKSKEDRPKKKSKLSNSEESGEDGIDCGSGASFAEALGMISPTKPKKKTSQIRDINSPNNSFNNDLSPAAMLAPSAVLAPLPLLEISALPEISPNYKPRPPPKLLPNFTDEDAISAGISSKNQRTKVYSGNKVIGKITSLYEMCVHVLQEHIDALEYTGGVPYDILKPVVDRATPQQLFLLEHYNPYLMEDTDHLWQKFCEKNFRNKRRQELESWREMYMRCQEEQESKLKSLTANIRLTQEAKKAPIKQTKMAYVDSIVKPPRNVARKQALHGTAHAASASPASRVASLSATPGVLKGGAPRPPPAASVSAAAFNKPKKAPLMQKALQLMRGRKR